MAKHKVRKPRAGTDKTKTRIMNALRKIWMYSKLKRDSLKRSKEGKYYRCMQCKGLHEKLDVDHVINVVPLTGWDGDWNGVINRMLYCSENGLQNLCKKCHNKKTQREQKIRKKYVKENKKANT